MAEPKPLVDQITEQRENDYIKQVERVRLKVIEEAGGTEAIEAGRALDIAVVIVKEVAADRRQDIISARMRGK